MSQDLKAAIEDLSMGVWDVATQLKGIRQEMRLARRFPQRVCPKCEKVIPAAWDSCPYCGRLDTPGCVLRIRDLALGDDSDG